MFDSALKAFSRMKFFINKTITKLFAPNYYAIVLKDEIDMQKEPFLKLNIDTKYLYSDKMFAYIQESLVRNEIVSRKIRVT